jgi:hypothetical protein
MFKTKTVTEQTGPKGNDLLRVKGNSGLQQMKTG